MTSQLHSNNHVRTRHEGQEQDGADSGKQPTSLPLVPRRRRSALGGRRELFWAAIFLAPALVLVLVLRVVPAGGALVTSLNKSFPGGIRPSRFAGLANYAALTNDPGFWDMILRTLFFNVVIVPVQIALALLIAVVMTRRLALRGLWRTLLFVPATVPIVGSSIAWGIALQPRGPVNALITALGGDPQPLLGSPGQALACIMVVVTWIGVGYWMVFLIAGIEDIPKEYYEAALVDRAGFWRTLFWVTIPLLKRPLLYVSVANTVWGFVLFAPIQLLTNGGPQNSTTMLLFDQYRNTFEFGNANAGAAEVVILTVIMLVFVSVQFWLLRDDDK
jgi:multiple sugar transport system permease protein